MTPSDLRRYRAERLLRKDFAALRSKVLAVVRSQLRAKGITLDASDLEACYAQAWHGLYATVLEGELVENPSAWLVLVTFRRAIDENRSAGRIGTVEGKEMGSFPSDSDASAGSLADELDNRARLRHIFEGMRASLSERECQAASLCYLQGLSRAQAAERMGISEARMGKLMEGAGAGRPGVASKVGSLLDTIRAGGWCEQQSSLMRAYAFGILDPEGERHALAVAHCRACPACRAHVASLRGLASVLPLPLLSPLALAGGTGVTAAGSGAGATAGGGSGASVGGAAASGVGATGAAGGVGAAISGLLPATRLGATGLRLGAGASRGWSAGSLTAKLAVTAVAVLATGYAVLGTRAHGSPPAAHVTPVKPSPTRGRTLVQSLLPAIGAPIQRGHATRHLQAPTRVRSPRRSRSARAAGPHEFVPERLPGEYAGAGAPSSISPRAPSPGGVSPAGGEFGIE